MTLTPRQSEILKAIIEEYIESAQPIASVELVERRGLGVSGATVRNIMSALVRQGYLRMLHVSSGRTPTDVAYRYYITELMDHNPEVSVIDELNLKQKVLETRFETERMLKKSVDALSESTNMLAFALTSDEFITYTGASKILDLPEFYEIDATKSVLRFVDDYRLARSVVEKHIVNPGAVSVLIGREIGLANMDSVSIVFSMVRTSSRNIYFGVIGPARMQYQKTIPLVRYMAGVIGDIAGTL